MARKVFTPEGTVTSPGDPVAPKLRDGGPRQPLAKGGAGAPRYIQSSVNADVERSHEDIPVNQIQGSVIEDRIDLTEDIESLMASIAANGQQIPITVRIVDTGLPFEIVAGRRRLEAIRRLGHRTIRGFVTTMTDEEAFVAQGIENSARLETSFIERARTAFKASEAGFAQDRISEFLAIKQPMVSVMTSIYRRIGEDLVKAIGPARGIGRRKWERLSKLLDEKGLDGSEVVPMIDRSLEMSPDRFDAVTELLSGDEQEDLPDPQPKPPALPAAASARNHRRRRHLNGKMTSVHAPGRLVIKVVGPTDQDDHDAFLEYLSNSIESLRKRFDEQRKEGDE